MTLVTLTTIWAALLAVVLFLSLARKWAARREDDSLHLHDFDAGLVQRQSSLATHLDRIDVLGKALTVVVLLYGAALIGRVLYLAWMDSLSMK
jgi:hypothetical protein